MSTLHDDDILAEFMKDQRELEASKKMDDLKSDEVPETETEFVPVTLEGDTFCSLTGITPEQLAVHELHDFHVQVCTPEMFDESVRHYIPTRERFELRHPAFQPQIHSAYMTVRSLERKNNTWAYGGASTGKTTFFEWYCMLTGRPYIRVTGNKAVTYASLFGSSTFEGDEVTYNYGDLSKAFLGGAVFLLDEPTACTPDAGFSVQELAERGDSIALTNVRDSKTDHVLKRHPEFVLVCADNTGGMGDEDGLYAGTHIWNRATMSRFQALIRFRPVSGNVLKNVLMARVPELPEDIADKIISFAGKTAKLREQGDLTFDMALREMFSTGEMYMDIRNLNAALDLCYINKLPQDERVYTNTILSTI